MVFEARRALEPAAIALAASRRTDSDIARMKAALEELLPVTREWGETALAAHREVHEALYRSAHNEVMARLLNDLWDKSDRYRRVGLELPDGAEPRTRDFDEHHQLVELVIAGEADAAYALMASHIDNSLTASALAQHDASEPARQGPDTRPASRRGSPVCTGSRLCDSIRPRAAVPRGSRPGPRGQPPRRHEEGAPTGWHHQKMRVPSSEARGSQNTSLRRANAGAAVLHAVQAGVVLALATDFALPVTASYLTGPPGTPAQEPVVLFEIPTGLAVAGFLALSALAHLLVCTVWWQRYVADLGRHRNPARWVEYSLSSSLMIVLIAQLVGISDVAALVALFGVNAAMILFGWLQERYERPAGGGWLPFGFGCVAGIVPWVAITIYLLSPGSTSAASPPGFVYGIFVSLFVFFNVFALNQWLQYRARGRWQDYLFGEKVYIVLSLTAKSALAWQVFAGTLAA